MRVQRSKDGGEGGSRREPRKEEQDGGWRRLKFGPLALLSLLNPSWRLRELSTSSIEDHRELVPALAYAEREQR